MDVELYEKLLSVAKNKIIKLRFDHADGYFFEYYPNHRSYPEIADIDRSAVRDSINDAIQAAINYFSNNSVRYFEYTRQDNSDKFNFTKNERRYKLPAR